MGEVFGSSICVCVGGPGAALACGMWRMYTAWGYAKTPPPSPHPCPPAPALPPLLPQPYLALVHQHGVKAVRSALHRLGDQRLELVGRLLVLLHLGSRDEERGGGSG